MKIQKDKIKETVTLKGDDALIHQITEQIIDNHRDEFHFSYYVAIANVFKAKGHYELNRKEIVKIAEALRSSTSKIPNWDIYKEALGRLTRRGYLYSTASRERTRFGSHATRAYGLKFDL